LSADAAARSTEDVRAPNHLVSCCYLAHHPDRETMAHPSGRGAQAQIITIMWRRFIRPGARLSSRKPQGVL
jgi:hypothetical protein